MLHLKYEISKLKGAEYNPRVISDDDIDVLAQSVKTLGIVKPIIVRGNLIVAGHQRTKALRKIGKTHAPVYVLPCETTIYDEIIFNQLHNGTDMDSGDEKCFISGGFDVSDQFVIVDSKRINGNFRSKMANVRNEICKLITKYGAWGGVVATQSGKVIHCAQYALAARLTNAKLTCYVIPDHRESEYRKYLDRNYGVFSYEHLKKDTYIQTFAQMMRLRDGPSGRQQRSTLYETMVIPYLIKNKQSRVIDFGSGQGDYAKMLRSKGYNVKDVELFRRVSGTQAIDVSAVNKMIDDMIRDLDRFGGYDVVVCDSVMNSVDSLQAEHSVMTMLNALCKVGGMVFFSGRRMERVDQQDRMTKATGDNRLVEFIDENGFTGLYRKGHWFYQKFHSPDDVKVLADDHNLGDLVFKNGQSTSWQAQTVKKQNMSFIEIKNAVEFEFNLPLSDKRRLNRHGDVLKSMEKIYEDQN